MTPPQQLIDIFIADFKDKQPELLRRVREKTWDLAFVVMPCKLYLGLNMEMYSVRYSVKEDKFIEINLPFRNHTIDLN